MKASGDGSRGRTFEAVCSSSIPLNRNMAGLGGVLGTVSGETICSIHG